MKIRRPLSLPIAALLLNACERMGTTEPSPPGLALDVVYHVPNDAPGPPFYSPIANGPFIPSDGEWAAVPFLRDIACVPDDVNLLVLAGQPAWNCALTVTGHEHWTNGPPTDLAPRHTVYRGLGAVPIVFVPIAELEPALADGLFLPELLALPEAIIGTATLYRETDILGLTGPLGPGRGMYKITASGTLEDSRPFRLMVNEVQGALRQVHIRFGQ